MRTKLIYILTALLSLTGCNSSGRKVMLSCSDSSCQSCKTQKLSCTLTSAALRERKATVIANLQRELIEKKELKDGYAFKFNGSDAMVDELSSFIKTERECCSFFTFHLSVAGDKSTAWLQLSGPDGAKDFITTELGL